ncbi:hypothetical protein Moror_15624 [Moniliophthora roreri MCA 2997]|uniref:Uncharacterized protein n=2 Tax=Moniliophthora roreri TaxID=221103 RepID=V2WS74_MONRO|nr:hypothetical protein Moror_15624 [Moniliophthora roreri MCA 2997]
MSASNKILTEALLFALDVTNAQLDAGVIFNSQTREALIAILPKISKVILDCHTPILKLTQVKPTLDPNSNLTIDSGNALEGVNAQCMQLMEDLHRTLDLNKLFPSGFVVSQFQASNSIQQVALTPAVLGCPGTFEPPVNDHEPNPPSVAGPSHCHCALSPPSYYEPYCMNFLRHKKPAPVYCKDRRSKWVPRCGDSS